MPNCLISDWVYVFNTAELFFLWFALQPILLLVLYFWIISCTLNYHCFWCLFYVIHAVFFLMHASSSSLVNITDFILSKFWYSIFTESRLLSLFTYSRVQHSWSCCTSCTAFYLCDDVLPCLCVWLPCRLLEMVYLSTSAVSLTIHRTLHVQVSCATICSFTSFSFHFCYPHTAYFDLVFVYVSLMSHILSHPNYCLTLLSALPVPVISGPTLIPLCYSLHFLFLFYYFCYDGFII